MLADESLSQIDLGKRKAVVMANIEIMLTVHPAHQSVNAFLCSVLHGPRSCWIARFNEPGYKKTYQKTKDG